MYILFYSLSQLLRLLSLAILVQVIMSWVYPQGKIFYWIGRLIEPIMAPFRSLSLWIRRRFNLPIDFSPWFAMIGINLVSQLIWRVYFGILYPLGLH